MKSLLHGGDIFILACSKLLFSRKLVGSSSSKFLLITPNGLNNIYNQSFIINYKKIPIYRYCVCFIISTSLSVNKSKELQSKQLL